MNFKTLFNQYIASLSSFKNELNEFQFDIGKIIEIGKTIEEDKNSFSYDFSNFKLVVPTKLKPSHTIPRQAKDITIVLSVDDTIEIRVFNGKKVEDPLIKLDNFNIILSSDIYYSSWHLDRHIMTAEEAESKHLHPIYHMTFGGHYMESRQEEETDIYGKSLILRAPRLMHPPLELILGLDFVFRHFIPKNKLSLLNHKPYNDIIQKLKKNIWFPFAIAMAKNYCSSIEVDHVSYNFDEQFVKGVIGHV